MTVIDTQGFKAGTTEDVSGGIREAARLMATYADATTVRVAVLAGKAVGLLGPKNCIFQQALLFKYVQ